MTLPDGTHTAVLDRFEDDRAVLLVERPDDRATQVVVDRTALPEDGRHADAVLSVTVEDGSPVAWRYRPDATTDRADATQDRFDRLSRRLGDDTEPEDG